jgi:hypothetical protein
VGSFDVAIRSIAMQTIANGSGGRLFEELFTYLTSSRATSAGGPYGRRESVRQKLAAGGPLDTYIRVAFGAVAVA